MAKVLRRNRKVSDEQVIRLNRLGQSLSTIAYNLKCHPSSLTLRLQSLGIAPADTRRAFMDDIYNDMPEYMMVSLADHLDTSEMTIKEYVKKLMLDDINQRTHNHQEGPTVHA